MPPAMKRKRDAVDAEDEPHSSLDARKSILDISMLKLRSAAPTPPTRKVEPSLRRSVLIFNTLKHIEAQLKQDGVFTGFGAVQQGAAGGCCPLTGPQQMMDDTSDDAMCEVAPPSFCVGGGAQCVVNPPVVGANGHGDANVGQCQCIGSAGGYKQTDSYLGQNTFQQQQQHQNTGRLPGVGSFSDPTPGMQVPQAQYNSDSMGCPQQACYHGNSVVSTNSLTAPTSLANPVFTSTLSMNQSNAPIYSNQQSNASSCSMSMSVTETLFSDTSKMLDTLLNSDRLVAVAGFTSLFELDNLGGNSSTNSGVNSYNTSISGTNSMSATPQQWGAGSQVECVAQNSTIVQNTDSWSTSCPTEQSFNKGSRSEIAMTTDSTTSTYQELHSPSVTCGGAFSNASCSSTVTTNSTLTQLTSSDSSLSTNSISTSCISSPNSNSPSPPNLQTAANHTLSPPISNTQLTSLTALTPPPNPANHMTLSPPTPANQLTCLTTLSPPSSPLTCRQECDVTANTATYSNLGDIDCNMFDFDLFMPSLSPNGCGKLTPLNHDDLAHSLPSTESPFSTTASWMTTSHKAQEHITDDLDHIMQILVGL